MDSNIQFRSFNFEVWSGDSWVPFKPSVPFVEESILLQIAKHYSSRVNDVIFMYKQNGIDRYTMDSKLLFSVSSYFVVRCITIVHFVSSVYKSFETDQNPEQSLFKKMDEVLQHFDHETRKAFLLRHFYSLCPRSSYFAYFISYYKNVIHPDRKSVV